MKPLLSRRLIVLAAIFLLTGAAPHTASAQTVAQLGGKPHRLSANALRQIAALEAEADARTPIQQKISSQLLFSLKMARGQQIAPGVAQLRTGVTVDGAGLTLVDIDAEVTPQLLALIGRAGGQIVSSSVQFGGIRARVPLSAVEGLAAYPGVHFVKPAVPALLNNPRLKRAALAQREMSVRAHLPALLSRLKTRVGGVIANAGSVTSEGDKTHRADLARSTFSVNGTGIKVGVLSDSLDDGHGAYSAAVSSGDVSTVTVISGQAGSGEGEGLAMLEIVHDLAPGAQLYFATGFSGEAGFASNIVALKNAGCTVIIDDVSYFDESPFQDATISKAVNTVTSAGALFFSSAANNGNLENFTASVWEGDFQASGNSLSDGQLHQFASGVEGNDISTNGQQVSTSLFWADPLGHSSNDYDLFDFDSTGNTVLASSTDRQTGSQDPYESVTANDGDLLAVILHSGSTRYLHLDINNQNSIIDFATTGRTRGHNAASNTFCIAATDATAAYPNPFSTSNSVETFSDDGPRHIFFNPDGTAITANNFTHTGGTVLAKPNFTAADGVTTTLPSGGLNPFYGTSAAAPHAGAIAALMLSRNKTLTRSQVISILDNNCIDIDATGYDITAGFGILDAYKVVQNTPTSTGAPALSSLTLSPTSGIGGSAAPTGTVTLTKAATASTTVTLSSSNSAALAVPSSVTVSSGSTSATFTATSHTVTAPTTVTITATYSGVSKTATFTVNPTTITSLAFSPTTVTGGSANSTGTVTLAGAVGQAITVTLSSSNTAALSVPASLSIPAHTTTATFTATSHAVTTATTVTVTATYNGGSKTATVTVNPASGGSVKPKTLTFNPNPAYTNSITVGTVTLTAAAPTGGTAVTISSVSGTTKTALLTATVPAGSTTMTFSLRPNYVSAQTTLTYSADANGGSVTATLTVKPTTVQLTGFTVTPSPASSSGTLTATVTLSAAAPTGGASAKFSQNGVLVGYLTVPAGSTTKSITFFSPQVTTATAYTYTAFYNNVTKTVTVTVNP